VLLELPGDHQRAEVDVAPAQGASLAAAQSDQGDQPKQRVEAVLADVVEESRGLVGGPDRDGRVLAGGAPVRHARRRPDHGRVLRSRAIPGVSGISSHGRSRQPTAGSDRAPQFRANPVLPDTGRHSKSTRMAADVHLPVLTIITRHYATLRTANF
jgi:hypothetical protein